MVLMVGRLDAFVTCDWALSRTARGAKHFIDAFVGGVGSVFGSVFVLPSLQCHFVHPYQKLRSTVTRLPMQDAAGALTPLL